MKSFAEFHNERVLNEVAPLVLPAIPYIVGGATILTDLAVSFVIAKLGYDALTPDSVSNAAEVISQGGVAVNPLTQASPDMVVDAIIPHITAEGTVAATAESASAISSMLSIPSQVAQSVLTYAAGFGLSTLDVCLIFGAGTAIAVGGGYMFYKGNGPKKFKKHLKNGLDKLYKLLKIAGTVALNAFRFLGKTAAAALSTVWGWIVGLVSSGLTAIIKKAIIQKRKEDNNDSKPSQDLPNTQKH
tara:strand:- start:542 stop:1273 length:732 start_codon:yes stop_codon:yes gene_type:complete